MTPQHISPVRRRRRIGALKARMLVNAIAIDAAPGLVAGLLTLIVTGLPLLAIAVGLPMWALAKMVARSPFPMRLLPLARLAVGFVIPLVVVGMVVGLGAELGGGGMTKGVALEVLLTAWLVTAIGTLLRSKVESDLPVRVALAGPPEFAFDLAIELRAIGEQGYKLVGWMGDPRAPVANAPLERLGGSGNVRKVVLDNDIDLIVWCPPERIEESGGFQLTSSEGIVIRDRTAESCLDLPVRLISISQFYERLLGHVPVGAIDSAWYEYLMHPRFRGVSPVVKRVFDLAVAVPMAIFALPIVGIAALIVRIQDGGPGFYRQQRLGEHGEPFEIFKLRSMRLDAEADGRPRWASGDDERVTKFGRFIRRTHIDELPQLWNVIRGEMTMVGPRPERPEIIVELEREFPHYSRRHLVKPGVTGWAAVRCGYAGSELGTAWKLCHDLFYIKHRSLFVDAIILGETVSIMFRDAHRGVRTPGERFLVGEQISE